jgi:hypothetical protein
VTEGGPTPLWRHVEWGFSRPWAFIGIGQRTSDALQVKKKAGVRLGRPDRHDPDTVAKIVEMKVGGAGLTEQCEQAALVDPVTAGCRLPSR